MSDENERSVASTGSLEGIDPVVRKPAAYIVEVDGIGSIMPLCRDMIEVDGLRSRFADRVRKVVPLYAWNEWDEIRKAGDRIAREEGFSVMEMELNAMHAENARLRWSLAAAETRKSGVSLAWIPVTERMPEDGDDILVSTKAGEVCAAWRRDGWWLAHDVRQDTTAVTHWMPLPAPPTDAK